MGRIISIIRKEVEKEKKGVIYDLVHRDEDCEWHDAGSDCNSFKNPNSLYFLDKKTKETKRAGK